MAKHLLKLFALTTVLLGAPASAAITLTSGPSELMPHCPQRARAAAAATQQRAQVQRPKAATTIRLMDRISDDSSLFHFGSRGFFAP